MKKISLLFAIFFATTFAWGAEMTLFSTDFSDAGWSGITSVCDAANAANETYNGITFHSYNSSARPFTINQSAGTMTWCNGNLGSNYWIAIPVTGVNGSITITVSNGSSNTQFKYIIEQESSISGISSSGTASTKAAPSIVTTSELTASDYVVYIGRQGTSYTTIRSITITTPAPVYLKPHADWLAKESGVNPRFAVYYFKSAAPTDYGWVSMTQDSGCDEDYFKANIPSGYDKCIFCRMKGNETTNKWENKINQTGDLTVPTGKAIFYTVPSGGDAGTDADWSANPFKVCVTGNWLYFKGETITLNAACIGASHYQWYKGSDPISGATSSTFTKANCAKDDAGHYYCKAWVDDEIDATWSGVFDIRVPYLVIQTPGSGSDRQDIAFTRANTSAETATGGVYLGVAWKYEFAVYDGIDYYGNSGTMTSTDCTNWTMFGSTWCKIETTKEGTYTFNLTFSNSTYTPLKMSVVYPPMVQTPGLKVYIENTPAMQARGWDNNSIYYRIGKGKYDDGDSRNWTAAQQMTLVPGTARYLYTTTPDWSNNFWVWHIANNAGWVDNSFSIYKTKTEDSYAITESSNFNGDEIIADWTIYLNSTSGGYGKDPINSNCQFYGYTHSNGMITHNASVAATTNGKIKVEYTHHDNTAQTNEANTARTINDLAHTCKLTITAVPDCGYKIKTLQVNGVDFTSGSTHILDADATIEATFEDDTYSVTLNPNGGTINSGNITTYTHGVGATLPTDISYTGKDFTGWYDNDGCTGSPVTAITTTDCGNKEYWANWVVGKPEPVFTWDYASTVNAGGIYPISVSSTGDANVTIEIVETITGVSGSFTAGNPATGIVTLGNYPAAETFTYRASSPETSAYKAKSETRTVTIVRCVKSDNLAYGVGYIDAGSSSKPRYYHETTGVGRIAKDFGGSGNGGDGGTWSGESWISKCNKAEGHLLQTYKKDVFKIVYYVKAGSSDVTISKLRIRDSYISSDSQGTNGLTGATIIYNGDPAKTGLDKNEQQTIEVTLAAPLAPNDFVYTRFSESSSLYGVKLYSAGGDEVTSVAFSGETEVEKYPGDAPFIKAATQTTTPILSGGSITYKSSDESVATVDPATSEVTVLAPGRTTITATLGAYGCFDEATATYSVVVKNCGDPKCTIAVTSGSARKCAGESVTLTATAAAGAAIQWYKDGAVIPGKTGSTLTTTTAGKYHATATKVCLQLSNTIEVENLAAPTAVALHEYYYIKAGRPRPDIPLFKLTNVKIDPSSFTMNHPAPAGCIYELREDGIIYLVGTPSTTLAASTYSLTVTTVNDCGFANASATLELRTLEPTAKKQIAWIGCNGEGKNQQPLPGTLDGSQSTNHPLYKYLTGSITPSDPSDDWFVLTPVNAYCTIDPQKISDYYSQFDLILLTDYPDSHVCPTGDTNPSTGEKYKKTDANSYSNAIGCLIDEIPILTFEAFVAGLPNWGINTKPGPESPTEQTITLLCSAHNIFNNTFPVDEQINFVTSSGMQGFAGLEAPPGMIYIATIPDGSGGTRITCCERQKVIEARMMMMGLNHNAMASVTNDGKTIIKQIIEYLLQFEEMADCALVFDNGANNNSYDETSYHAAGHTGTKGDGLWSTAANWHPAYNAVPKPFQAVRVDRSCQVDVTNAHCSSIRLRKDGAQGWNGNLTIHSDAGLTVIDYIKEVRGTNYMTTYPSAASDLVIKAGTSGQNGSLAFGNSEDELQATVEYYSLGKDATAAKPVWQYMGIPITNGPMAIDQYHAAWMCSWESEGNVSSNWVWVENEDRIVPFKGYCITQQASKKYIHVGALCTPNRKELPLHYFTSVDGNGFNMFANSWVAPIDIAKMRAEDFDGAEPTIYVYNTGSREQYEGGGDPSTDGTNIGAGQFNAVPVNSAPYMSGALTKIPTMQGFFVQATREGTLTLDYDRICFNSTDYTTTAETMRAPKRRAEDSSVEKIVPEVMRLDVVSANWGDRLYILTHEEFSDAFDRGWDGSKQEGDAEAPMLAFIQGNKQLAVAAIESLEERELSFRAGNETEYTFCFNYEGETIYLYDRLTGEATEIKTGNTYSFTAENKTPAKRFIITKNPPRVPTDIENTTYDATQSGAEKCIIDGQLYIIKNNRFYDARGVRVTSFKRKEVAP